MAYEDVAVDNITLKGQVGIANVSDPMGDGVNSGLIGLAYPWLTSTHSENIPHTSMFLYDRLRGDLRLLIGQSKNDEFNSIASVRGLRQLHDIPPNLSCGVY